MGMLDLFNTARLSGLKTDNKLQTRQMELSERYRDMKAEGLHPDSFREYVKKNPAPEPRSLFMNVLNRGAWGTAIGGGLGAVVGMITGAPEVLALQGAAVGAGGGIAFAVGEDRTNGKRAAELDGFERHLDQVQSSNAPSPAKGRGTEVTADAPAPTHGLPRKPNSPALG